MGALLQSIGILVWLIVMFGLVVAKVNDLFPAMDNTAWLVVAAIAAVWIGIGVGIESGIGRIWPARFNEDLRMLLAVLLAGGLTALLMYPVWLNTGDWLTLHFGPAAMD